jgi:hypothetical protein
MTSRRVPLVLLLGFIAVAACSSTPNASLDSCFTCDGNIAVTCDFTCSEGAKGPVTRVDCGAKKCAIVQGASYTCTSQGTAWVQDESGPECQ